MFPQISLLLCTAAHSIPLHPLVLPRSSPLLTWSTFPSGRSLFPVSRCFQYLSPQQRQQLTPGRATAVLCWPKLAYSGRIRSSFLSGLSGFAEGFASRLSVSPFRAFGYHSTTCPPDRYPTPSKLADFPLLWLQSVRPIYRF